MLFEVTVFNNLAPPPITSSHHLPPLAQQRQVFTEPCNTSLLSLISFILHR